MTTDHHDHTVLDLFAGTGVGVALQQLGATELGVEIMPEAIQTRTNNGMQTIYNDVWESFRFEMFGFTDTHWGSPPCPTFSMAGGGSGRLAFGQIVQAMDDRLYENINDLRKAGEQMGDPRTPLTLTPLHYAYAYQPRTIILEQVPPVLPVWQRMAVELEKWGYSTWTGILHAEQFGVPQTRKRAILIARRDGIPAAPPKPTHSKYHTTNPTKLDEGVEKWVSMYEALSFGMTARPSYTVTGGGTDTGGAEPIGNAARQGMRREIEAWRWKDRPATTVAGDPRITSREHHYEGEQNSTSLRITKEEAKVLQSYPNGFEFSGNKGKQFQQIGNAVPPLLAKAIFEEAWK